MFGLGFFPFWDCPIRYPLSVSLGLVLFQRILEGIYSFCISTPPYVAFCNYLSPHLLHLLCGNRRNQERCPYACGNLSICSPHAAIYPIQLHRPLQPVVYVSLSGCGSN